MSGPESWRERRDWVERRVTDGSGPWPVVLMGGFAAAWYGFLALIAWLVWAMPEAERTGPLVVLAVFAAAGLMLVVFAVRVTAHWLRFPPSVFELDAVPFAVGGWVAGLVVAPKALARADEVELTLDCLEVWQMRRGESEKVVWREEAALRGVELVSDPGGTLLPVAFSVPPDARPTGDVPGNRIKWRLTARASLPGPDYVASFEVPVLRAAEPAPPCPRPLTPARMVREAPDGSGRPAASKIRVEHRPGAVALQYPSPPWVARWTIAPVVLVVAAALIGRFAFAGDTVSWLVCIAVGLALAGFLLCLTAFGVLTHPNRVEVRPDVVIVRRGLFGRGWDRRIPRREVVAVDQVPFQNGPRVDYTVDIRTRDGKSYNAALGLRDRAEALWLARELDRLVRDVS